MTLYGPSVRPSASAVIARPSASLPAFAITPLKEVVTESVAQRRFSMLLLAVFAMVALFLAALLLYQGMRPSLRMILVSALGAIVLWLLFDAFLGIDLPSGLVPEPF